MLSAFEEGRGGVFSLVRSTGKRGWRCSFIIQYTRGDKCWLLDFRETQPLCLTVFILFAIFLLGKVQFEWIVLDSLISHTMSPWAKRRVCRGRQRDPSLRSGWQGWCFLVLEVLSSSFEPCLNFFSQTSFISSWAVISSRLSTHQLQPIPLFFRF